MKTKFAISIVSTLMVLLALPLAAEEVIIEDAGVTMTREEVAYIVGKWPEDWQKAAAVDPGDRIELLSIMLSNKKLAEEALKVTPADQPERYWHQQMVIRNTLRNFAVNNYLADLDVPDMTLLAKERYLTEKDKYAAVPESRLTSHILFLCSGEACETAQLSANSVWDQLKSGAVFEELATEYSEDPGSKEKGGRYDQWLFKATDRVDARYLQAAFELENVGDTAIVRSAFGVHIIRLDELKEKHYLPYEEVVESIKASLEQEYTRLAAKEFDARFRLTDGAFIDTEAMDSIFGPFQEAPIVSSPSTDVMEGSLSAPGSVGDSLE